MTDNIKIPQQDPPNYVDAADGSTVTQPDNSRVGGTVDDSGFSTQRQQDLIRTETLRRWLFGITVGFSLFAIILLYITLICWVYKRAQLPYIFGSSSEVWHIATILALPPTTILFLLIKVLSKNTEQNNNNNSNPPINIKDMPVSELFSQTMKMIEDIKSTITGKK